MLGVLFVSCNSNDNSLFVLQNPIRSGINHQNEIISSKELNVFKYRNFYNGGGVGIGDINNDGLSDVYFTINRGPNKLYLNKGDLKFEDISEKASVVGSKPWSTGVVMVDINADGWLDIYVCNAGLASGEEQNNELFVNQKDGTFIEMAEEFNLADSGITTHAAFFDYDLDGDLDVYLLNNSFIPVTSLGYNNRRELRDEQWQVEQPLKGGGDRLLRNDNMKFVDVSEEAGIYGSLIGFGLGVTIGDINQDGYVDIYVSNDFYERDYLYINQQDGTFKEEIMKYMNHLSHSSMGADMADINNDSKMEVFVTDMLPEEDQRLKETTEFEGFDVYRLKQSRDFHHQFMQNTLQLNNGNDTFSEISTSAGVESSDWSWGALLFDMDSDGYRDIFICNGIYHELTNQDFMNFFANEVVQKMIFTGKKEEVLDIINKMPTRPIQNYAYKNNQKLSFSNESENWGFDTLTFSNGAAYGDLDNDGDLDLVINNVNQPAMLYQNTAVDSGANFLKLKVNGSGQNTFSVGAKIYTYVGKEVIFSELIPTRGFQSSIDYVTTIGLGKNTSIDSLKVVWQSGKQIVLKNLNSNQLIELNEKDANHLNSITKEDSKKTLFTQKNIKVLPHIENNYVDYNKEVLAPRMLSREGPAIATGDVNRDGMDDFFIGNASGSAAQLMIQNKDGSFTSKGQSIFEEDKEYEDTAVILVDLDNDNDLDLFVGSGGNDASVSKNLLQDRIYLNDGKGNFKKTTGLLPSYFTNTSVIAPYDMDQDGDIDLFIGNRSETGIYGIDPTSVFLENTGESRFKDATGLKAYDASKLGMITDAEWIDMSGDDIKDLVLIGEWMSPVILENRTLYLEKVETNLTQFSGWWNTIISGDFNEDGKVDFVFGNKGTNSVYQGTSESPARMFINDYDQNGTLDQILTRQIENEDRPVHVRNELAAQISKIKKENLKYSEYAKKGIRDLFSKEIIDNSIIKTVNESKTILVINKGDYQFEMSTLPNEVQWNSVNSGIADDFNQDGKLDILLSGGEDNLKPQFAKLDAGFGELLIGDGQGDFEWIPYVRSGLKVKGTVRASKSLVVQDKKVIVFGINDDEAIFYVLR